MAPPPVPKHSGLNKAQLLGSGHFMAAAMMDVDDIRSTFGDKYDGAIGQMLQYVRENYGDD